MIGKLIPKIVTIESTFKPYGETAMGGMSSGSTFGMTLEVPEGLDWSEVKKDVLLAKEQLDLLALTTEYGKGILSLARFQAIKAGIKSFYDKILKRTENVGTERPKGAD